MFARFEHVVKDALFTPSEALAGEAFLIRKASLGYVCDFAEHGHLRFGIGGVVSRNSIPAALVPAYGSAPVGYSLFIRARLVP